MNRTPAAPLTADPMPLSTQDTPTEWPRPLPPRVVDDRPSMLERVLVHWRTIAGTVLAAGVLAGGGSFLLPRTYVASAVFVPEQSKSNGLPSGLGALAGEFGIMGAGGGTDSPEFYQRLLVGRALTSEMVAAPVGGVNLFQFFRDGGRADSVERAIRDLQKATTVSIDKATTTVRIDVELRSPQLAAAVVARYLDLVNDYNSTIRRTQAGKRRQFVQAQTAAAQADLQRAESNLKDFLQQNRIASSPDLQFERGQLDRRVNSSQELFLALSRQLQTARIDEVNDTPVISVVDPPFVPLHSSGPHRVVIVLMAMFCGGLLSLLFVAGVEQRRRGTADGG